MRQQNCHRRKELSPLFLISFLLILLLLYTCPASSYSSSSSGGGVSSSSEEDEGEDGRNLGNGTDEESEIPLRDPLSIAIPMTIIYSLILLSGIMGNLSTMVVIYRNGYMHSATNYYLMSLAMSDLLLLISGLPQDIYVIWIKYPYIFGEAVCVIRGLAAETSANATVLTITAFTVERFVAIVYPLKSHMLSKLSRVVKMIGIIWLVAFCLALPQAAQFGLEDHHSSETPSVILIKGAWCTLTSEIFPFAFQISFWVFFAIPMTIISVLYILIWRKLRQSRQSPLNSGRMGALTRSQTHVVRMLVAVVVAFFICWAPFHAQRLIAIYFRTLPISNTEVFVKFYEGLTHISGVFYYLSTCINPILYHIMSHKFRKAFKDTMGRLCGRPGAHHRRSSSRFISLMSHSVRHSCRGPQGVLSLPPKKTPCTTTTTLSFQPGSGSELLPLSRTHLLPLPLTSAAAAAATSPTILSTTSSNSTVVGLLNEGVKGRVRFGLKLAKTNNNGTIPRGCSPFSDNNNTKGRGAKEQRLQKTCMKKNDGGGGGSILRAFLIKDREGRRCSILLGHRGGGGGRDVDGVVVAKGVAELKHSPSSLSLGGGKGSGSLSVSNSISNSSLQNLDDPEFTSEELADYMGELNLSFESKFFNFSP